MHLVFKSVRKERVAMVMVGDMRHENESRENNCLSLSPTSHRGSHLIHHVHGLWPSGSLWPRST